MCQVYFWEVDESQYSVLFDRLLSIVSVEKRERVLKLRFPIDQLLTLCAEVLIRFLVCSQYGIKNDTVIFTTNEYGKPSIQGYLDFYFNISHTRSALVVAVSDSEIGIDIERVSPADTRISDRYFSPAEKDFILQSADKNKAFYQIWTKKEAYIKHIGRGLSIPLTSFNVLDDEIANITQSVERSGYIISVCGMDLQVITLVDVRRPQFGDRLSDFINGFMPLKYEFHFD